MQWELTGREQASDRPGCRDSKSPCRRSVRGKINVDERLANHTVRHTVQYSARAAICCNLLQSHARPAYMSQGLHLQPEHTSLWRTDDLRVELKLQADSSVAARF